MNRNTKLALLAGGTIVIGAVAYALAKVLGAAQGQRYVLQIQAGDGGTTDPAPSPSGIFMSAGKVVTITAKPNSGYTVGNWLLDGVILGNAQSIQVTMNMNHAVIVTFWEGGVEPPSYPVAITNQNTVTAFGRFGGKIELDIANAIKKVSVHSIDQNDTWDGFAEYPMYFKVIDASGKGVPNIPVDLYVGVVPDNTTYIGYVLLNMNIYTSNNPLRLYSDGNGVVTVNLGYMYGLDDRVLKLCRDADLGFWALVGVFPIRFIAYDADVGIFLGFLISKDGGGATGERPAMGNFFLNTVHAKVTGTSIQAAQGLVYCGFSVKWL